MSQKLQHLEDLEDTITTFQEHRQKAAKALWEIEKDDLYEERGYGDVKTYAVNHFQFGDRRRIGQLVDFGHITEILEGEGNGTPQNEGQARELAPLLRSGEEEDIRKVWELATDRHGLNGLTATKLKEARYDYQHGGDDQDGGDQDEGDQDEEDGRDDTNEPERSEVDLTVPSSTAEQLGLFGDDGEDGRIVSWNGYDRSDLQEIIEHTDPETTTPTNCSEERVLGPKIWRPVSGEEEARALRLKQPERIEIRPNKIQRLQASPLPLDNDEPNTPTKEDPGTLACPGVDLLSDDVPEPVTKEVLSRSGGTEFVPIFLSSHAGRWTNHSLPNEAWVGARADRSSIEETAEALHSADDTALKWTLYDISGEDRREGLPDADLSAIDWLVIDELNHSGVDLPVPQLQTIRESAAEKGITVAARSSFTTTLDQSPTTA